VLAIYGDENKISQIVKTLKENDYKVIFDEK